MQHSVLSPCCRPLSTSFSFFFSNAFSFTFDTNMPPTKKPEITLSVSTSDPLLYRFALSSRVSDRVRFMLAGSDLLTAPGPRSDPYQWCVGCVFGVCERVSCLLPCVSVCEGSSVSPGHPLQMQVGLLT